MRISFTLSAPYEFTCLRKREGLSTYLLKPLKQIFDIVLDLKLLQEIDVFLFAVLFGMVLFLVQNVVIDISNLQMAARECTLALLPGKFTPNPFMIVDEVA